MGTSILRGQLAADGHLSSASWDVYVVLDDGQIGAWGAGMDVWDSTAAAREAAEREAGFFSCDGPREPVADLDESADDFAGSDVVQEARQRRPPRHRLRSRLAM